jgi:phage-related protein
MPTPVFPTVDAKGNRIPNPSKPLAEGIQTNNLVIGYDSGHEQRRRRSEPRRTWEVNYTALRQDAYDTIYGFFMSRGGNFESFFWDHPVTKARHLVRFNSDFLQSEYVQHGRISGPIWKMSFKLIQVWE